MTTKTSTMNAAVTDAELAELQSDLDDLRSDLKSLRYRLAENWVPSRPTQAAANTDDSD